LPALCSWQGQFSKRAFATAACLRPQGHLNGLFISRLKRCFINQEKAKNAQKGQKNDQKLLFLVI